MSLISENTIGLRKIVFVTGELRKSRKSGITPGSARSPYFFSFSLSAIEVKYLLK